jgi:hypothetical protein
MAYGTAAGPEQLHVTLQAVRLGHRHANLFDVPHIFQQNVS